MDLRPLRDKIIVKVLEAGDKSKGGLYLPDTAKEKPQQGKIIAVGSGKLLQDGKIVPLNVKPGDKVLFGKYSGSEVKIDDEEYLVMDADDVLAIIK
jgi:chaperonin GroES